MVDINRELPKNYCPLPFVSLSLLPGNGIMPCCNWAGMLDKSPVLISDHDPFNHEWIRDLRKRMLDDKVIPGCSSCKHDESINLHSSMRMSKLRTYGYVEIPRLIYLDYNLGNLCNLKCRMCDGFHSSSWHADEAALGKPTSTIKRRSSEHRQFDLSQLRHIRFIGGEPMIEQNTIVEILRDIRSSQNGRLDGLTVTIHTNGTVRFSEELGELLGECDTLNLTISVDGIGKINDYQRTGYDWHRLEGNLRYFNDVDVCRITNRQIDSTLTLLNVSNYIELHAWIAAEIPGFGRHASCITHPAELRICNIPHGYKQVLKSRFSQWDGCHIRDVVLAELDVPPTIPIERVRERISALDAIRGEDFSLVDPEMYDAIFG